METEEDKELMKIRLETLKTMVGKLEKKKSPSIQRVVHQQSKGASVSTKTQVASSAVKYDSKIYNSGVASSSTYKTVRSSNTKHRYVNPSLLRKTNDVSQPSWIAKRPEQPSTFHKHPPKHQVHQQSIPKNPTYTSHRNKFTYTKATSASSKHRPLESTPILQQNDATGVRSKFVYKKTNTGIVSKPPEKPVFTKNRFSAPNEVMSKGRTLNDVSTSKTRQSTHVLNKYKINNTLKYSNSNSSDMLMQKKRKSVHKPIVSRYKYNSDGSQETSIKFSVDNIPIIRNRFCVFKKRPAVVKYKRPFSETRTSRFSFNRQNLSFAIRRSQYLKSAPTSFKLKQKISIRNHRLNRTGGSATSSNAKSKANKLVLSRHGNNYLVSSNMKSLTRMPSSNVKNAEKRTPAYPYHNNHPKYHRSNSLNKKISTKQVIASQMVRKSRLITASQRKKKNKTKYCLFFNRYGQCKRGEKCDFIHDLQKVAVCTRFLRGTCKDEKCLFSHKIDPNKMPVCSYFLSGQCTKDDCPYRHVNVNESADVCQDFLKGYCPQSDKCTKKHVLECNEFTKTGKCSKGEKCKLFHRAKKIVRRRKRRSSSSGFRRPKGFTSTNPEESFGAEKATLSPLKSKDKSYLLPKFISEKLNSGSYSAAKAVSFADIRSVPSSCPSSDAEMSHNDGSISSSSSKVVSASTDFDFIPIGISSSEEESDSDDREKIRRRSSMTEKDFISLE